MSGKCAPRMSPRSSSSPIGLSRGGSAAARSPRRASRARWRTCSTSTGASSTRRPHDPPAPSHRSSPAPRRLADRAPQGRRAPGEPLLRGGAKVSPLELLAVVVVALFGFGSTVLLFAALLLAGRADEATERLQREHLFAPER